MSQSILEAAEFAENPEPRCPCVLLLDTSGSMQGEAIKALNEGLKQFQQDINRDPLAKKRLEIAIVTFDSEVKVVRDFIVAEQFQAPALTAQGQTFMGTGILRALDITEARKRDYKANGITYYRPWVFMITDGEPQGESESVTLEAGNRVKEAEEHKKVAFYAVGVQGANLQRLAMLAVRTPVKLIGLNFTEMFVWLSKSTENVCKATVGEQVALPPPGWAAANTDGA